LKANGRGRMWITPTFVGSALRKIGAKLSEAATIHFIRIDCLICESPGNDYRREKVGCASTCWIHTPEGLVQGLERSRYWR
jgi:hypothetical protein